jgi:hypothetical protein
VYLQLFAKLLLLVLLCSQTIITPLRGGFDVTHAAKCASSQCFLQDTTIGQGLLTLYEKAKIN